MPTSNLFYTLLLIVIFNPTEGISQSTLTNEQKFLKSIFAKYPNEYFQLGCDTVFLETYDTVTEKLSWKFSFRIVDSSKTDERKYLIEDNDRLLRKYLGDTHLYYGRHSHHYELGRYVDFVGYVNNETADFVNDTSANGLKKEFVQLIKGISISDIAEKEKFAQSLLTFLAKGYFFHIEDYRKIDSVTCWSGNELVITDNYVDIYNDAIKHRQHALTLRVFFEGDTISTISLK